MEVRAWQGPIGCLWPVRNPEPGALGYGLPVLAATCHTQLHSQSQLSSKMWGCRHAGHGPWLIACRSGTWSLEHMPLKHQWQLCPLPSD